MSNKNYKKGERVIDETITMDDASILESEDDIMVDVNAVYPTSELRHTPMNSLTAEVNVETELKRELSVIDNNLANNKRLDPSNIQRLMDRRSVILKKLVDIKQQTPSLVSIDTQDAYGQRTNRTKENSIGFTFTV